MAAGDISWLETVESLYREFLTDSRLNVEFISEKVHLSERQFRRKLKQLTGLSPNQYLQEMRLHAAHGYLSEGLFATIKEVAHSVGINDVRYFSNLFQKRFGLKPSALKEMYSS